jgi:hypothetical protein
LFYRPGSRGCDVGERRDNLACFSWFNKWQLLSIVVILETMRAVDGSGL